MSQPTGILIFEVQSPWNAEMKIEPVEVGSWPGHVVLHDKFIEDYDAYPGIQIGDGMVRFSMQNGDGALYGVVHRDEGDHADHYDLLEVIVTVTPKLPAALMRCLWATGPLNETPGH